MLWTWPGGRYTLSLYRFIGGDLAFEEVYGVDGVPGLLGFDTGGAPVAAGGVEGGY